MKKSAKRNVIVSALLSIVMCISLIVGVTMAVVTSESKVNIAITGAKIDVVATVDTNSIQQKQLNTDYSATGKTYSGEAEVVGGTVSLKNFVAGDGIKFNIIVKNNSTVTVNYRTVLSVENNSGLFEALKVVVNDETYDGYTLYSKWQSVGVGSGDATITVAVELPEDATGYQGKTCDLVFAVEAVQGNAETSDYPNGITTKGFEEVTNVEYTDNLGNVVTGNKPAVAAYVDGDGQVKYVGDIYAAITNGASVIYCKKDATLRMREREADTNRSPDLTQNLTIYAYGADFQNGEISMNMTDAGKAANVTLKIYDAKNIKVWGYTPNDGVTQTIVMENCHNDGEVRTGEKGIMMYITGKTGTVNATVKNCYIAKNSSGIYMSTNGSLTVLNSTFVECATGIKSSYKGNGTRVDRIENCTFTGCGCTAKEAGTTTWLSEDSAAIKCKISDGATGTFNLTLKNNTISGTVGSKGDMQIASAINSSLTSGASSSEDLATVIKSAQNVTANLAEGTYTLPSLENKELTVVGTKDTVIDMKGVVNKASSATFDGVTVEFANESYKGFQHTGKLVYKNCELKNLQFLYADEVEFIGCKFTQANDDAYHMWTYGAKNVIFTDCEFYSTNKSKSILCYIEGTGNTLTRTFNNCKFVCEGTKEKSAIMINPSANAGYNTYVININNCTATGYGENRISGQTIVGVKATVKDDITVNINGKQVYRNEVQ